MIHTCRLCICALLGAASATCLVAVGCQEPAAVEKLERTAVDAYRRPEPVPVFAPTISPRRYSAPFSDISIQINGLMDEPAWSAAPWSDDFADIEGSTRATPLQRTRVKMLWDAKYLYIAADLAESDLWATLKTHDEIVFQDNDFEVFVDPDGDTREYYEIEVNALGTIFDLYLPQPYRAAGKANHNWTAEGMRVAIHLDGTLNDSRDTDKGWQVEMAIPWTTFAPVVQPDGEQTFQRASRPPCIGDSWRINFSRVQWMLEKRDGSYAKVAGTPEYNWTWTPQWAIDMHIPQWWGFVTFVGPTVQKQEKSK